MGVLRLYLAVCVVFAHSSPLMSQVIHGGEEAVQIFFMISGFYMSLIAPKYNSVRQFYYSRFLRIFFPYWIVLGVVIVVSVGLGIVAGNWLELSPYLSFPLKRNGFVGVVLVTISNLTIFLQDGVMFLQQDYGEQLAFTSNFRENATSPLYQYLLIPQAWTISLELYFYLLFPFMNKLKNKSLVIILMISLFARIITYEFLHQKNDPWNYRFFPFEIAFFIIGMLCFRAYSTLSINSPRPVLWGRTIFYFFTTPVLLFLFVNAKLANGFIAQYVGVTYAQLLFYLVWAFFIPVLFHFYNKSSIDRIVGELSYPVYLIHFLVVILANRFLSSFNIPSSLLGIVSVTCTIFASIGFHFFIINKLENLRRTIVARQTSPR